MANLWTSEEIESILIQLDKWNLPFSKYTFSRLSEGLSLLGRGGFAEVYKAETRKKHINSYAIKVMGLREKRMDSASFRQTVNAQINLQQKVESIVRIFDSVELRLFFDSGTQISRAEVVQEYEKTEPKGDFLTLQFIVMERVTPVINEERHGKEEIFPKALAEFNEKEVLKMASEIGSALSEAHSRNLLHRDVKLENVFYSTKRNCYQLGDFGISKSTKDGLASTVAFTKGYGAPEVVGTLDDRYDQTADIYSFGIMLFVILNELHFPDSNNYHVNIRAQYSQGYVLPNPINGSEELVKIVKRMCCFSPDDRYQTVDEILNDIDMLLYGERVKYNRKHKNLTLAMGTAFMFAGFIVGKLAFLPEYQMNLSFWMYIFLFLCIWKGLTKSSKKSRWYISLGIVGVGVFLLISSGFSWWKFALLLFLSIPFDVFAGVFGGGVLLMDITGKLTQNYTESFSSYSDTNWMAVLFISFAIVFFKQYFLFDKREIKKGWNKITWNRPWIEAFIIYGLLALCGWNGSDSNLFYAKTLPHLVGTDFYNEFISINLVKTGMFGLVFSGLWVTREYVLMKLELSRQKKSTETNINELKNQ